MPKVYMYGLVGRRVKIGDKMFYGHKSYSTQAEALKEAKEARAEGHQCRVVPGKGSQAYGKGPRYVLLCSVVKKQKGG
jgi:hypothetical protein